MESKRNAAFAAWVDAEAAAYAAIHMLHQRTCGGRTEAAPVDIEKVARLRRSADIRFADFQRASIDRRAPQASVGYFPARAAKTSLATGIAENTFGQPA